MRRRAHAERLEQEAEPRLLLLRRDLQDVEHARLKLGLVDPHRAAAELLTVADQVVRDRQRRTRIALEHRLGLGRRARERMVDRGPALILFRPLEHREVRDPGPDERLLVDEPELVAKAVAQRPEHARDLVGLVGAEEHRRARIGAEGRELGLREELRDRRPRLSVLAVDDVREPLRPPLLREGLELLEIGPRVFLRHGEVADGRRAGEDLELGAPRELGRVLDLEAEAQVGLVRAVAEHRVRIGHALERRLELDTDRLAPDLANHLLHQLEDELDVGEGHLDVELRQLLRPVGAQILVAEAAGDLVVALEAGDHEQLLGDLRRLRQREEAPLLETRRDQEVARALGSRLEEDRGLDVQEPGALHHPADDRDHLGAEPEVALEAFAPEVEPAVPDAQRLVDVLVVELERERRAGGDDLEPFDLELDLAGRQARVDVLRCTRGDLALGLEDELVADVVRRGGRLGACSGLTTSWLTPVESRRSMKTRPPWSRRFATQPASVWRCPTCSGRTSPAPRSRQLMAPASQATRRVKPSRPGRPASG